MSYVFDLGNPATNANPFPEFARLRAEDPVHWSPAMKAWIVTRYADVKQVALNNRQISADRLTPFFKTNPRVPARLDREPGALPQPLDGVPRPARPHPPAPPVHQGLHADRRREPPAQHRGHRRPPDRRHAGQGPARRDGRLHRRLRLSPARLGDHGPAGRAARRSRAGKGLVRRHRAVHRHRPGRRQQVPARRGRRQGDVGLFPRPGRGAHRGADRRHDQPARAGARRPRRALDRRDHRHLHPAAVRRPRDHRPT